MSRSKSKKESAKPGLTTRRRKLPMVYNISKVGLSVEQVNERVAALIKADPDWHVVKTEVTKLKGVIEKDPKRARVVGVLTLFLKSR